MDGVHDGTSALDAKMTTPSDDRAILAANRDFYAAFESLDMDKMAEVWLQGSSITCIHPGWARLTGWGPVMKSWEDIFASTFRVEITITGEHVCSSGDLAWVTCTEHLETHGYDGVSHGAVEATNVFERREGKWYVVHHHGSPLVRSPESGSEQLQ
jgi:ketosteroid isomerase-like protein